MNIQNIYYYTYLAEYIYFYEKHWRIFLHKILQDIYSLTRLTKNISHNSYNDEKIYIESGGDVMTFVVLKFFSKFLYKKKPQ